jgi:hypothetical protein
MVYFSEGLEILQYICNSLYYAEDTDGHFSEPL